jgi:nucleoside-diphosphate-sugar epimerase
MKILITGGLGFIGAHLVNAFKDQHEITILDKYDKTYPGYAKIYRGSNKGVVSTNDIEDYHRDLNLKYRMKFVKDIKVIRNWSFNELPNEKYDLILNCGGLCEAILSHRYPRFCKYSIAKGTENLKKSFDCPMLHISSSMVYGTWEGKITEEYPTDPVDKYGANKVLSECFCTDEDIILRPIHVYGIGDSKFPIWMNIERQIQKNQPVNIEAADCIYIDDFVQIVKNILDSWKPGIYNISSNHIRNGQVLQDIYHKAFEVNNKLGPTGKPRGTLNSSKLFKTFNVKLNFNSYNETIRDYYKKYENFRSQ